jgi:hypothetical protein
LPPRIILIHPEIIPASPTPPFPPQIRGGKVF